MNGSRALDWLHQAQDDLRFAQSGFEHDFFSQVCFLCQQSGEKAIKALAFYRGFERVKSYSIIQIAKELKVNGELEQAAKHLDSYYISARYPDGLPSGAPFEVFTKEQASLALRDCNLIIQQVQAEIGA